MLDVEDSNSESSDLSASSLSSAESDDDAGESRGLRESERKRAREEKYKGKPILQTLEPNKVASFLEEFQVYETNVVRGRLKLPNADISLSLSNQVQVMLQDEGVSVMRRRSVMKYLNNINRLQNKGKEKILMRKVENLMWSNEGTPMKSMTHFLKQVTDMVRGIKWETKSMEREFCLKVIKKLPLEFGSENAKETQSIKKWKTVGKLRRGLNEAAMIISEWDLQSPALKLLTNEPLKNKNKISVKSDPAPKQRPRNPRGESTPSEGVRRTTLEDGSVKHFLPKTWSKEKRKQYGMDHNLCLFCYPSNHRLDDCKLVKQRDAKKEKTVNEIEKEARSSEKLEAEESSSEDEDSVFVGAVEVLDVEESYGDESEDFMVGSLDPVDLGEILVEDEFEVGGDVGKPHVTDNKVQAYLRNKVKEKVLVGVKEGTITSDQAQELESILLNHLEAFGMEALKKKLRELEDMGMIRREPNPFFSSPVIMVLKPGKRDEYKMVVDLRRCNRSVKPTGAGLPDLETQLAWFKGTEEYFGSLDGLIGFDYLRVEDGAQKYLGMVTPWGCYAMLMAPQGYINTPPNISGKTDQRDGDMIRSIFLKLEDMGEVRKMGQLEDLVYVSTWLASSVPDLARKRHYLSKIMKELERDLKIKYKKKLNKHQGRAASVEEWWSEEDQDEVRKFLKSISSSAANSLNLYQLDRRVAIFTDASFHFWSGVLGLWDSDGWLPIYFGSGEFVGSSIHWSMTDKEIYPIIKLMKRYRFILYGHQTPIELYTDHKNLIYLMTPKKDMKAAAFGRVQRLILTIQEFVTVLHHLPGETNVLADLLTRWGYVESEDTLNLKAKLVDSNGDMGWRIRWKGITFFANSGDVDVEKMEIANMIDGPENEEVLEVEVNKGTSWRFDPEVVKFVENRVAVHFPKRKQERKILTIPETVKVQEACELNLKDLDASQNESGAWINKQGKIIIPGELIERFIVTAHNDSGHGSVDEVMRILEPFFFVNIPRNKQKILVQNLKKWCLHCDKDIKMIRRPLGEIYHLIKREVVLHLDFLKVKESYILVILEDVSRKVLLIEDPSPCAAVVVRALVMWRGLIGLPPTFTLVSDNGSHFNNEVLKTFESRFPAERKFSIVYSPWSNGSIEVMNRFVLRVLRQLCSCYMIEKEKRSELLPQLMDVINNSRSRRGYSPNELTTYLSTARGLNKIVETDETSILPIVTQVKLRECKDPGKFNVNFAAGDFVLISRVGTPWLNDKISLRWIGPYIVVAVQGEHYYKVKSIGGKEQVVHSQRMVPYQSKSEEFKVTSEIKHSFYYNQGPYYVKKLLDLRNTIDGFEVLIWWQGFPKSDSNWQCMRRLYEDVPQLVREFVRKNKDDTIDFENAHKLIREWERNKGSKEVNMIAENVSTVPKNIWLKERIKIIKYPSRIRSMSEGVPQGLTRSKGWSLAEKIVFEKLSLKFGIGNWKEICSLGCLPGKTKSQMVTLLQV
eukprot:maker-scaffold_34-augustus-gene-0.59-mRNA-1 protein AED:0.45 eAED:0.46 QI:0/0/0/0.5/0.66/0.5/4/0/1472